MLINPKVAIEQGWIKHPDCKTLQDWYDRKFISPNAIDFTLDRAYMHNEEDVFTLTDDKKTTVMRRVDELYPGFANEGTPFLVIPSRTSIDALSNFYCDVPEGVACKLVIRSTLNRNGMFLTSGLYDSGYQGQIGFALHNLSGPAEIQVGVRIGQIEFWKSDSAHKYEGGWNHVEGTHWSEDVKA